MVVNAHVQRFSVSCMRDLKKKPINFASLPTKCIKGLSNKKYSAYIKTKNEFSIKFYRLLTKIFRKNVQPQQFWSLATLALGALI